MTSGQDRITTYGDNPCHSFCQVCGTRLFATGDIPNMGGAFARVFLSALDDVTPQELIDTPLTWCDGLNNNWWTPPDEVRHL